MSCHWPELTMLWAACGQPSGRRPVCRAQLAKAVLIEAVALSRPADVKVGWYETVGDPDEKASTLTVWGWTIWVPGKRTRCASGSTATDALPSTPTPFPSIRTPPEPVGRLS